MAYTQDNCVAFSAPLLHFLMDMHACVRAWAVSEGLGRAQEVGSRHKKQLMMICHVSARHEVQSASLHYISKALRLTCGAHVAVFKDNNQKHHNMTVSLSLSR